MLFVILEVEDQKTISLLRGNIMKKRIIEEAYFETVKDIEAFEEYIRDLNKRGVDYTTFYFENILIVTTVTIVK